MEVSGQGKSPWYPLGAGLDMVAKRKIPIISPPGNCVARSQHNTFQ
jgi:hypothetical protein